MKKLLYNMAIAALFMSPVTSLFAQTKKSAKHKTVVHTTTPKFVEHNFATPTAVTDIKDISATDDSYGSIKNLVENDKVTLAYDDNTFKSNEPLRRGDFIVAFNSALDALKKMKTDAGVDSAVIINTYDRKRTSGNLNNVSQIKDLKETSLYYPASKSLLENYGVAEPFLSNNTLSPGSLMTEKEVYDILHNTLGYTSTAYNPYSTQISRGKFAIALNNALMQKSEQIADLHSQAMNKNETERRAQQAIMDQQNKIHSDSISRAMQAQREAVMNTDAINKSKTKHKRH